METPIKMLGRASRIHGKMMRGWNVKIGIAVEIMVKTISGRVEMGIINDQTDLPALSMTFCWRFLFSGDSASLMGRRFIFREMAI